MTLAGIHGTARALRWQIGLIIQSGMRYDMQPPRHSI
jgi:hypothetical protein